LIKKEKKELNAVICDFGLAGISSEKNVISNLRFSFFFSISNNQ